MTEKNQEQIVTATPDPILAFTAAAERFRSTIRSSFEELQNKLIYELSYELKKAVHEVCDEMIRKIHENDGVPIEESPVPQTTVPIETTRCIIATVETDCGKDSLLSSIPSAPVKSIEWVLCCPVYKHFCRLRDQTRASKKGQQPEIQRFLFQHRYHTVRKRQLKKKGPRQKMLGQWLKTKRGKSWRFKFKDKPKEFRKLMEHEDEDNLALDGLRKCVDAVHNRNMGALSSKNDFFAIWACNFGGSSVILSTEVALGVCIAEHPVYVTFMVDQIGMMRETSQGKSLLHHHFAAEGGNMQSKMALAFRYLRQNRHDKAVHLYTELAETSVNSFLISKDSPIVEPVRIHTGTEENKVALRKFRGEDDDEDFQILEYQAEKGNPVAVYNMGLLYNFGLRGLRRDHAKTLYWFTKAVDKGEPISLELLGEIYARGVGVERNYVKAPEYLTIAVKQGLYSAFNGLGYLNVKGYGVAKRNYMRARLYFVSMSLQPFQKHLSLPSDCGAEDSYYSLKNDGKG